MQTTVAAHTRDFARRFFILIEDLGSQEWLPAADIFARTLTAHPDHPYVALVEGKPACTAAFTKTAEQLRQAEFAHIEHRKAGTARNAPVFYRTPRPAVGMTLELPYQVPSGHPLRTASPSSHPLRREPDATPARSPWRRRRDACRPRAGGAAEDQPSAIAGWWQALTARR